MKALVLGGSQFVGLHTVRELVARGWEVTVLNRGKTATQLPTGVARLRADRTDPESMKNALEGKDWDAVFDTSGFLMAAMGASMPALIDLLDGHVGTYVYTSSIMVYEPCGLFPWRESFPLVEEGPNTYGGFKKAMETALLERHDRSGFPACIVRPAAIYGPDNNIYDMEMAYFIRLLRGLPILLPHDGLVTGSYGHVDDLCRVMVDLAGHTSASGEAYNVTGEGVSAREYVTALSEIVGRPAEVLELPSHWLAGLEKPVFSHLFGQYHHGILSTQKARERLGYEPDFDFRSGHAQTFEWFLAEGLDATEQAPVDPLWFASYDFEYESRVAEALRSGRDAP